MTFYTNGYHIVRNLITLEEVERLSKHLSDRFDKGTIDVDYSLMCVQTMNSPSFYGKGDDVMMNFQIDLLPKIESHSGLNLFKTYSYARKYKRDDILRIHTDRAACEISITIDLGGDKWPIWVLDRDENPVKIDLNPGDGVLYRGCELSHWRSKFKGDEHIQIFVHYVDKYGPCAWAKDDLKREQ
tara:strand:+ start:1489 stop:2043 length:555 start_codon:yes stop_codon:yes gene_type:complete